MALVFEVTSWMILVLLCQWTRKLDSKVIILTKVLEIIILGLISRIFPEVRNFYVMSIFVLFLVEDDRIVSRMLKLDDVSLKDVMINQSYVLLIIIGYECLLVGIELVDIYFSPNTCYFSIHVWSVCLAFLICILLYLFFNSIIKQLLELISIDSEALLMIVICGILIGMETYLRYSSVSAVSLTTLHFFWLLISALLLTSTLLAISKEHDYRQQLLEIEQANEWSAKFTEMQNHIKFLKNIRHDLNYALSLTDYEILKEKLEDSIHLIDSQPVYESLGDYLMQCLINRLKQLAMENDKHMYIITHIQDAHINMKQFNTVISISKQLLDGKDDAIKLYIQEVDDYIRFEYQLTDMDVSMNLIDSSTIKSYQVKEFGKNVIVLFLKKECTDDRGKTTNLY